MVLVDSVRIAHAECMQASSHGAASRISRRAAWLRIALPLLVLATGAGLWHLLEPEGSWDALAPQLAAWLPDSFAERTALALIVFVLGGFLSAPLNGMILLTILLFGPWPGAPVALAGSLLNSAGLYGAGRALGRRSLRQIAGSPVMDKMESLVQRAGIAGVVFLRMTPIAPFSLANLACGALGLRFRVYLAGTALGLLPGLALMSAFGDRVLAFLEKPDPGTAALLLIVAVGVPTLLFFGGRWIRRRFVSRSFDTVAAEAEESLMGDDDRNDPPGAPTDEKNSGKSAPRP